MFEQAQPETIVLLHGIARTPRVLRTLEKFLLSKNYHVENIAYPSTRHKIFDLANQYLHQALQKQSIQQSAKIHFVTHSMGGLVLRAYLQAHHLNNLGRVVMIAPPNQGSEVAEFFLGWKLYRWLFGPAGQELGLGEQAIFHKLNEVSVDCGIITGNKSLTPLFSRLFTDPNDGKVSIKSAQLKNMKDFLVVSCSHTLIVKNALVLQQVFYFLQNGRFQK